MTNNLSRVTAKIFASNAPLDTIGQFGSALNGTKINTQDVAQLQGLPAYENGWNSAVISDRNYPTLEEMNGVLNVMSYQTAYGLQKGMPEWDVNTTYYTNSFCQVDGTIYKSLTDNNIGNNPTSDTTNWEEFSSGSSGRLELCDIGTALYVDETKGLRRYLNGQVVAINTNTQAFLNRLKKIQAVQPALFVTEEQWQAEALLSTGGYVDKFVIADDESTVRLPNYPDYITTLSGLGGTIPVVGTGMALGLTNGTVNIGLSQTYGNSIGFIGYASQYGADVAATQTGSGYYPNGVFGVTEDPENSGVVADISSIKEQKITLKYFIQIATGQETENNIVNDIELNNPYTLFDCKYTDAPLYNLSWLRSTGVFYDKATYPSAYEALQVEYNSEIAQGTTVQLPSGTSYTKRGLSVKLVTETYTDYDFILNTTDETFRLPLKTKLASGKAIVGNGLALGLTDGTNNAAIIPSSTEGNNNLFNTAGYGSNVGTSVTVTNYPTNNVAMGVTTDPTKSGIETSDADLYLYFYVGETVQNANLIDAGRIEEKIADIMPKLDGELISYSGTPLLYLTTPAVGYYEIDLSNILPNDGLNYDLFTYIDTDTSNDSSSNNRYINMYCSENDRTAGTNAVESWCHDGSIYSFRCSQFFPLLYGTRTLYLNLTGTSDAIFKSIIIRLLAYRKRGQ